MKKAFTTLEEAHLEAGTEVGPFPKTTPKVKWKKGPYVGHYASPMTKQSRASGKKMWTGTGWTGQPVVRTLKDGREEVIIEAYDRAIHFFDANSETGTETRKKFQARGIIKGTVSLDPYGAPLLYAGPVDRLFRVLDISDTAKDSKGRFKSPKVLFHEDSRKQKGRKHTTYWDSSPMIVGDYVFAGSENSFLYIFKVQKKMDTNGRIIDSQITKINTVEGYTSKLIREFGMGRAKTSIENSPVIFEDRIYFSNSSGLVQGHDINVLINGGKRSESLVFEYWVGDDVDSTIVVDEEGSLYVAVEDEISTTKAQRNASRISGHFLKLNPYKQQNPIEWSFTIPKKHKVPSKDGFWATPSINKTHVFITAHNGNFYILERDTGKITYSEDLGFHNWASTVLIGDKILVPTCSPGGLILYDISKPERPQRIWKKKHPSGCIESTPLVWKGNIFVGSRDGYFYKFGN